VIKLVRIMLVVLVLLSLGCLSCGRQVTSGLNMRNPEQARASETVVLTITNGDGSVAPGIRIYSPEYLGETDKDGRMETFFKEPGEYELTARKGKAGESGFAKTKALINIVPGPIELLAFDGIVPPMPPGQTYTGEQHYKPGMTVRFRLKNISSTETILNNSSPWKIETREGTSVFEPIVLQVAASLAPGEDKEWTWNQKDANEHQVSEGGYIVVFRCSKGEYRLRVWVIPENMMP